MTNSLEEICELVIITHTISTNIYRTVEFFWWRIYPVRWNDNCPIYDFIMISKSLADSVQVPKFGAQDLHYSGGLTMIDKLIINSQRLRWDDSYVCGLWSGRSLEDRFHLIRE